MNRSIARLLAAACTALMLGAAPIAQTTPAAGDAGYVAIEGRYFAEFMRSNPGQASGWGVHSYDATLGSMSAGRFAQQIASEKRCLAELNASEALIHPPIDVQCFFRGGLGALRRADEGWGNGDPRVRLAQLSLALQRESRFLVGLREHTQGMSVDQATQFFMTNAFMGEEPSRREALRGTQDPLYGYYTLGKLELLKLRDDYKKKAGSSYSLQRFHDELLAHGDPPMSIVRREILGASDDGRLL